MALRLKMPTERDLRTAYERDLRASFPPSELKPLYSITSMRRAGRYQPWCLYEDCDDKNSAGNFIGECFLWLGNPGFALLDYLCVKSDRRNAGLGGIILSKMLEIMPDDIILCESETPGYADDPDMAERRLKFYTRNGAKTAGFEASVFGVRYQILYWLPEHDNHNFIPDSVILEEYAGLYQNVFPPDKYARYFQIPVSPESPSPVPTPWKQ